MNNIYYVDYENVSSAGLKGVELLTAEDQLNILYSKKADNVKIDVLMLLMNSRAVIRFIPVHVGTPSALDFQLVTLLYLHYDGSKNYCIISKDSGYDCAIRTGAENGALNVLRCDSIENAVRRLEQKFSRRGLQSDSVKNTSQQAFSSAGTGSCAAQSADTAFSGAESDMSLTDAEQLNGQAPLIHASEKTSDTAGSLPQLPSLTAPAAPDLPKDEAALNLPDAAEDADALNHPEDIESGSVCDSSQTQACVPAGAVLISEAESVIGNLDSGEENKLQNAPAPPEKPKRRRRSRSKKPVRTAAGDTVPESTKDSVSAAGFDTAAVQPSAVAEPSSTAASPSGSSETEDIKKPVQISGQASEQKQPQKSARKPAKKPVQKQVQPQMPVQKQAQPQMPVQKQAQPQMPVQKQAQPQMPVQKQAPIVPDVEVAEPVDITDDAASIDIVSIIRRRNIVDLKPEETAVITDALNTSKNKQQFYNFFIKKLGQKPGLELYHKIKSSYTDLILAL